MLLTLPGLHISLRNRSFSIESIDTAGEAMVLLGLSVMAVTSVPPRAECKAVLWTWGIRAGRTHPKHSAPSIHIYFFKN